MCTVILKFKLLWSVLILSLLQKRYQACPTNKTCQYYPTEFRYSCLEILPDNYTTDFSSEERKNVTVLELCGVEQDILDLQSLIEIFPNVSNVTVVNGNVTAISNILDSNNKIKVLLLNNISLAELPLEFFNSFQSLQELDLSGNHLRALDASTINKINKLSFTTLADNKWNCSSNLEWVLSLDSDLVKDMDDLKCYGQPYPGKPLLRIARFKKNVHDDCPPKCECTMPDVVRKPSTSKLEPIIEVNCSDRNLKGFPPILPAQTKIVMLERNRISNLQPLISNPIYRDVQDLYLDNNYIDSIDELEGSYWLSHFRVLSLKNNRLAQLPTYALDNALQQNNNMPEAVRIYLGDNPWRCDCIFTPGFQEMLRKYETQVRDIDGIKCSYTEGDENSLTMILELSRSSVCRLPNEYSVRALDLLNGILASLIVLILGKLAYDYYHFKKTGKLPWIVTKMP